MASSTQSVGFVLKCSFMKRVRSARQVGMLLVQGIAILDHAHVVLHAQRDAGKAVVLGDRHVDHQVAVHDLGIDRQLLEALAAEVHVAEAAAVEGHDLAASPGADGRADAAGFVALGGDVAGVVAHLDRLGAGLEGRGGPAWPPRRDWCWRPARGLRSQPMFGLTQTTSPRLTKRFRPPSPAMAFSVSFTAICFMSASAGLAPVQRAMVMSTGLAAAASSAKRRCGPKGQHAARRGRMQRETAFC